MITLADYYLGRDQTHGVWLATGMRDSAALTVALANQVLAQAEAAGITLHRSPRTGSIVTSGWRPAAVNEATPGARPNSKHISCRAIDLYDPEGDLDEWLLDGADTVLKDLGLWLEHPAATKGWTHLQTEPPRSGRRVFFP